MHRRAWWAAIHEVAKSQTRLHFHFSLSCIGEGNGNPLQCSCLGNPRDEGGWWAAVYGVAQSWTRLKQLSSSSSMMFIACTKHSDKNFLSISSCDTLSNPLRQALLFITDENIWGSESRSCISNYQDRSQQVLLERWVSMYHSRGIQMPQLYM